MAYENIPGVGVSYLDGAFKVPTGTAQPKILILGPAKSGLTYEIFNVNNVRRAEQEFGSDTQLLQGVHEAIAQGADNISVMRVGGRKGSLVITDSAGGTLTIVPEYRDDAILDNYALLLEVSGSTQRILVWDLVAEDWVYDSEEIFVLDEGVVEVTVSGFDLFTLGTVNDETTYIPMSLLAPSDFTPAGSATIASITATQGSDGTSTSLVEKYAALNSAYHMLDYRDADFVAPVGVYIDDKNVVDSGAVANFFKGVPVAGASNDELGYVWQYIYQGNLYTYFTDSPTYFSDQSTAAASTTTVNTDLTLTAQKTGVGGDNISIEIDTSGAAGPTVTITEPDDVSLKILVVDDGTSDTATAVAAINTALGLYTLANGVTADTLVQASGGSGTLLTTVAETNLSGGAGGHVLTHEDLTGDSVPADVTAFFANGQDSQLREVNFAHQLASFCDLASTTWKAMLGSISFLGPDGFSRSTVANWVGSAARYVIGPNGQQLIIDSPSDNGTGILGHKLLAGEASSTGGYRNSAIIDAASASDGLAYGGLIKTKGLALPNGDNFPEHSYGIDSDDELLDENGAPYDIGKHIFVTYDWPIHRNAYNGGTQYRGPVNITLLGKLATMPVNEEPIGQNGRVVRVTSPPRIHATQLDQLASIRAIGLRREEGVGYIFVTARTAAHPDSDYTRVSTIRSVNFHLEGLRNIAKQYIGKDFSAEKLISLQGAMDSYLQAQRQAGFNQGARVSLSYTRTDKILGRLNIKLRMVPPFSIEHIDIETSLAADETEL